MHTPLLPNYLGTMRVRSADNVVSCAFFLRGTAVRPSTETGDRQLSHRVFAHWSLTFFLSHSSSFTLGSRILASPLASKSKLSSLVGELDAAWSGGKSYTFPSDSDLF